MSAIIECTICTNGVTTHVLDAKLQWDFLELPESLQKAIELNLSDIAGRMIAFHEETICDDCASGATRMTVYGQSRLSYRGPELYHG